MTQPHLQALYAHYPAVIALMPPVFTSHEFIRRLFQRHQSEFIDALHVYRSTGAPMRQLTSQLSRQLHQYPGLVSYRQEVDSPNIFGDPSKCAEWERV